jgi:hypothetical protein
MIRERPGIARAENRSGPRSNVRDLHPILAVKKKNIPLNGCCKFWAINE